jgi:3-isopropylmalate/(R)-2-methylmalate dehydratase small subunit
MKQFSGQVLFLDRSDINTDEIIPARYLTENTREALQPFLFEDLTLEGFNPATDLHTKSVIITRVNFGCGSSREHAPWALETNGIHLVIAESFARIFKQNMFNCGMLAIELSAETLNEIFSTYAGTETHLITQLDKNIIIIKNQKDTHTISFPLSGFNKALIMAGGWVEYADLHY